VRYLIFILLLLNTNSMNAELIGQDSGLKLPRFVSIKSDESNLRIGANIDYPIRLTYILENFPLEIVDEYQLWRKVKDIDNNQGWIHKSLLKGNRYGIIKTSHDQSASIYNKPMGVVIGKIGNRNIIKINKCFSSWCHIRINNYKGWVNKINLWGVYPDEKFNMPFYQFFINLYWQII